MQFRPASFFLAGFECSTHRRSDGVRLDLTASTRHDSFARADYDAVRSAGLRAARDGIRWHVIERQLGHYDWSDCLPMLRAAEAADIQVIWDLCHYGWPDGLDIWSGAFVDRFAAFAAAFATLVREETEAPLHCCPVNEMSFWAWVGGDKGQINPATRGRGNELKRQLVRATLAAIAGIRDVDPRARFVTAEPLIHVASGSPSRKSRKAAENYRQAQFEATDMLVGRSAPELGGHAGALDIVGVNFYPHNQWYFGGGTIPMGHHAYRPLREMLVEVQQRYGRPVLIAETGAEGYARPYWLNHVCGEARAAAAAGTPVAGVCLYPVLDYPGWDNDRPCEVGLLGEPNGSGVRAVFRPLLEELNRQRLIFEAPAAPLLANAAETRMEDAIHV